MGRSSDHFDQEQNEPETPQNKEQQKETGHPHQQQMIIRMPVLKLQRIGKQTASGADDSCGREAGLIKSACMSGQMAIQRKGRHA